MKFLETAMNIIEVRVLGRKIVLLMLSLPATRLAKYSLEIIDMPIYRIYLVLRNYSNWRRYDLHWLERC
jgi:hypothetical protein